jgi:hypothetical protein
MADLAGTPVGRKWQSPQGYQEEELNLVTKKLSGGLNTYLDPADIAPEQSTVAQNWRIQGDKIFPRLGSSDTAFEPQGAIPNSNPILQIARFARFDGTSVFTRFDEDEIWRRATSSWVEITGTGFTVAQRQQTLAINDRFFFTTGTDPIQEIDFVTDTYADLGNAPKYKYMCGFFNRILAANLYDASNPNPIQVGWSGDLNFDEWSPLVDISAGNIALVEGQGDYSDAITGIFGFAAIALIMRERSLWTVTKRAVVELPFQFTAAYPNVGSDSPDSIAQTKNGLTWYDFRSNQVYTFEIGNTPIPIGFAIRNDLRELVTDNLTVQGSYDPIGNRYQLCIPSSTSDSTVVYVFDFETATWVKDIRLKVNGVWPLDEIASSLAYDDLVGSYDDLVGDYDDLDIISVAPSTIVYGRKDGVLLQDDDTVNGDDGELVYSFLQSKVFTLEDKNMSVAQLLFKLNCLKPCTITVFFSRNGGYSWTLWKTFSLDYMQTDRRKILTCHKQITTSEFAWKVYTNQSASFELLEYRIEAVKTTDTRGK